VPYLGVAHSVRMKLHSSKLGIPLAISLLVVLLVWCIVAVGAMLQGGIGFGLGTFSVPLLLLVEPAFVPGPMLLSAFVLTLFLLRRERASVAFFEVRWGIVGRGVGSVAAAVLLVQLPKDLVAPVVAGLVLVAILFLVAGWRLPITRWSLLFVGTMSGLLGTAASIGGPPLAMLYVDQKGGRIRGTLSGIFVAGTLMSVTALFFAGRFGLQELKLTGMLLPGVAVGYLMSRRAAAMADKGFIRPAIIIVSGLAAILSIVRYTILA